jgi:metal-responsive CopG/Arc/MetJ family transcriptional regulator
MTLTVRLDAELEREFAAACRIKRTTRSAVVTELIRAYVQAKTPAKSPFDLAEEMGLIGCMEHAPATAREHSRYIKEKLRSHPRGALRERRSG